MELGRDVAARLNRRLAGEGSRERKRGGKQREQPERHAIPLEASSSHGAIPGGKRQLIANHLH
jgi:hypothetical protein